MNRLMESGGTVKSLRQALGLIKLGAPLHPILVHFTIALTSVSLAFDAISFFFSVASLSEAGWWTLAVSVIATMFTLATGVTSRLRLAVEEGEARSFLRAHMALGPVFFGLLIGVSVWRAVLWETERGVSWWYLSAMAVVALVMGVQGYLGGELVYRYGAEVERDYRELPVRNAESQAPSLSSSSNLSEPTRTGGRGGAA
ncbi:MAG: DUF2231 domain-containing protein [Acidobacteria bacterium]|nr:DUF2231 domain-containing protein [Acidobacteriota bacterium]